MTYIPTLNPEQHRFRPPEMHYHLCVCGLPEGAEVHQRYERAAAPFREAKLKREEVTNLLRDGGSGYTISAAEHLEPISYSPKYSHQDHIHFTVSEISKENLLRAFNCTDSPTTEVEALMNTNSQNPDDMEKAALRLATLAQEIREHDEREPQGEEPVITWKHTFVWTPYTLGSEAQTKEYTYVAVKLGDKWYVTGNKNAGKSYAWRDFLNQDFSRELTTGNFLICTEWTSAS